MTSAIMSGVTVQEVLESLSVFDIQAKDDELEKSTLMLMLDYIE